MNIVEIGFLKLINKINKNSNIINKITLGLGSAPIFIGIFISLITRNYRIEFDIIKLEVLYYFLIGSIFVLYMTIIPQELEIITTKDNVEPGIYFDEWPCVKRIVPLERVIEVVHDPKKVVVKVPRLRK